MSIRPPSDIVLDVARAAKPERLAAATERLAAFAARQDGGPAFAQVADRVRTARTADHPATALSRLMSEPRPTQQVTAMEGSVPPAYERFEAFVLQSFVETMLPKESSVFGAGTAGNVWKGFLAEQVGAQIARAGGIGIGRQLAADARKEQDAAEAAAALWPDRGRPGGTPGDRIAGADKTFFQTLWQPGPGSADA